ncbi:N-acetylmuramoyl-L-alanine amidase [Brevibacillus laterosporus]|uniref:N-acetylmuramoyl-L-alanine amidase n=1 Tax=Brevibacillus laterosporus TaxID=1465 RepID=UPI000EAB50CA|nr:N-acetylmuramoyl-L-alanine amidase [Brevibacillus laterosporus]AYK08606.1 N-acetylmuramoyl-L-alanine amidase [Brevibacillus laterosporus]
MKIIEKLLTPNNYSRPRLKVKTIKGIVIHWVAAPMQKAINTWGFFENRKFGKTSSGSAHYIIDLNGDILRCIPENEMAYHVGSKKYTDSALERLSTYPNNCTIGIECNHIDMSGKMTSETYQSLLEFCVQLLKRYNLTENDLWLHKEVVGWKDCHRWFVNNPNEWALFKEKVGKALHGDTSKNTTTITKEKVVYIMSKYFKDIPEKMKWVSDPADRLYEKGIVLGDEKGNLHPDQPATRAEVITFIDRAVEYVLKEVK